MTDELVRRRPYVVWIIVGALVVVLGVVVWAIVFGDNGDHPPTDAQRKAIASEECPVVKTPHFYKIERDGKVSYLLGTRHAGVGMAKYPKAVEEAYRNATTIVTETTYPEASGERKVATVEETLGPKLWEKYQTIVGEDAAQRVNKLGVQVATAQLILLYEDTSQLFDLELVARGRQDHKQLVGLEDPEKDEVVAPEDDLGNFYLGKETLKTALEQTHRRTVLEHETRRTLRQYCNGGGMADLGSFEHVTNERTHAWVPKLVPILDAGGAFVAVGSMHVDMGTLDLTELLMKEGFTVRPALEDGK